MERERERKRERERERDRDREREREREKVDRRTTNERCARVDREISSEWTIQS